MQNTIFGTKGENQDEKKRKNTSINVLNKTE